jgi:hypothetical protein
MMAKRKQKAKPAPLTVPEILAWADAWHKRRRTWPKRHHGHIPDAPLGTTWRQVHNALRLGHRGLPGGSSLARLLAAHRGVRNKQALPGLTEYQIEQWARHHRELHGAWPTEYSGTVAAASGETWQNINCCLREGFRGLPGGETLPQLLGRRCEARTWATMPRLTVAGILAWADAFYAAKGTWPNADSGLINGAAGETWTTVDGALMKGGRGLQAGSSLVRLLVEHRGVRSKGHLPRLTRKVILAWAKAHHERKREWPTPESGPVEDGPGETWKAIDLALHQGLRGLPGGSSLHALLVHHGGKTGRENAHVRELSTKGRGRPRAVARRKKVLELRQRGLSLKQIAKRLGITHQGVAFLLKTGEQVT